MWELIWWSIWTSKYMSNYQVKQMKKKMQKSFQKADELSKINETRRLNDERIADEILEKQLENLND